MCGLIRIILERILVDWFNLALDLPRSNHERVGEAAGRRPVMGIGANRRGSAGIWAAAAGGSVAATKQGEKSSSKHKGGEHRLCMVSSGHNS
jgi:hypothetical protein